VENSDQEEWVRTGERLDTHSSDSLVFRSKKKNSSIHPVLVVVDLPPLDHLSISRSLRT
jgi:hypothetical protein